MADYLEFRRPSAEMIQNSAKSEFAENLRVQALQASMTPTTINVFKIVPHFDTEGFVVTLGGMMMVETDEPGRGNAAANVTFPWSFYLPKNVAKDLVRLLGQAIAMDDDRRPEIADATEEGDK